MLARFRPGLTIEQQRLMLASSGAKEWRLLRGESRVGKVMLHNGQTIEGAILALRMNRAVEFAEPNYLIHQDTIKSAVNWTNSPARPMTARQASLPNDPRFAEQWALQNLGGGAARLFGSDWIMAIVTSFQETSGWRGIVPLHSTRADVERLLGQPTEPCRCIYKTDDEVIRVEYAVRGCENNSSGWNVARDTVVSLRVTPKKWQRFSDLGFDEKEFTKRVEFDNPTTHYTNKAKGVRYTVTEMGMVYYVTYIPATKDSHLRCTGFPSTDRIVGDYRPFDFYAGIAFNAEKARLDNFAIFLLNEEPQYKGYIMVYAGQRARSGIAQARAKRAKNYLVKVRGVEAARIVTIDGGRREKLAVELYALPSSMSPPAPNPYRNR
ncbi:MAG TPA: hypothetical protein VFB65_13820 [Pyrinomonadaceae bacterium]|nr:hypothetical protein [Pyrinomonadaceae bacterium]